MVPVDNPLTSLLQSERTHAHARAHTHFDDPSFPSLQEKKKVLAAVNGQTATPVGHLEDRWRSNVCFHAPLNVFGTKLSFQTPNTVTRKILLSYIYSNRSIDR